MEQLRRVLATIQTQMTRLTVSQRLLIGSLVAVAVMGLFLTSLYAGRSNMVPLLPGATPDEQQKAAAALQNAGIQAVVKNGGVVVPESSKYVALAQLQQSQKLPADKKLLFDNLAASQNMWMPRSQLDQMATYAAQNELAKIIANFPGVESADVFISNPPPSGLGTTFRKPTATVTVATRASEFLSQDRVDSLADLVAGSVAGLQTSDVRVVDNAKGKRYRARSADDFSASSYLEQAMNFEKRVQDKLLEGLGYIDGVIVTVNAQVDVTSKSSEEQSYMPKGKGTESLVASETTKTNVSSQGGKGSGPGVMSNVGMDISQGAAPGTSTSEETTDTKMDNRVGTRKILSSDPGGRPTRVNVAVAVPMSWAVQVYNSRKGGDDAGGGAAGAEKKGPTLDQLNEIWDNASTDAKQRGEKQRLEEMLQPLVNMAAGEGGGEPGKVVVSMIPVLNPVGAPGSAGNAKAGILGGGGGGMGGMLNSLAQGPLLKTVLLGGLAVVALGMMVMMVRKSTKPESTATAEELAGIPPKLTADSDLVGEAGEGDTAMMGIEIDDDSLRGKKMLEQVTDLIKKNPGEAATVFNRWLATEN